MSFSLARFMRERLCSRHEIAFATWRWNGMRYELARRGGGKRESGCFLLGKRHNDRAHVEDIMYYDELDPACLRSGAVRFNGLIGYPKLWSICEERKLTVVADVHTHPGRAEQSWIDRQNPMLSIRGHIALIIPNFAMHQPLLADVGLYQYLGGGQWRTLPEDALYVGVLA